MKDLNTLYPALIPIVNKFVAECAKVSPITIFCTRRDFKEQAVIYPSNPTRFSHHLWGGSIDVYPAEYRSWGKEFQTKFNNWPHWDKVREIGTLSGFDPPQLFNVADKPHFQKLFGIPVYKYKDIWNQKGGDYNSKLLSTWKLIDVVTKGVKNG